MKNNLAIRLEKVLMQDKSASPQRLLPSLKADLRDVIRQYGEINDDVTIEIQENESGYSIIFLAKVTRFKSYGNVI